MLKRRSYPTKLVINEQLIDEIIIDPHYEISHSYMNDKLILEIVEQLNGRKFNPVDRKALLLEIEEDGKLLQQKYREHQEHSNKFRFNPEEYVSGLVEGMKKAIERNNPDGGGN
ncbi:10842_t:CDS:2, partial [Funneliformis geosporum]